MLTKQELAEKYAKKFGERRNKSAEIIGNVIEIIHDACVKDGGVKFIGEFSLEVKEVGERKGRNPKTGEEIVIPAHKAVKATIGKALKDAVKNPPSKKMKMKK